MQGTSTYKPTGDVKIPGIELKGDRKIDVASYELKKVIHTLPDGAQFNIVLFHKDAIALSTTFNIVSVTREEKIYDRDKLLALGDREARGKSVGPTEGDHRGERRDREP